MKSPWSRPFTYIPKLVHVGWNQYGHKFAITKVCLLCGAVMPYYEPSQCPACHDIPATHSECISAAARDRT